MGDNANNKWQWHNTEIGSGYQAKFVVRQPGKSYGEMKIVDMRGPNASEGYNLSKEATASYDNKNIPLKRKHIEHEYDDGTNDGYKNDLDKSRKTEIQSKDNKKEKKQKKEKKEKKHKEMKHKKSKRSRSHSVSSNDEDDDNSEGRARNELPSISSYNPLMQLFVSKLSDDVMS